VKIKIESKLKEEIELIQKIDNGYFDFCIESSKIVDKCPKCNNVLYLIIKNGVLYAKCSKCKEMYEIK